MLRHALPLTRPLLRPFSRSQLRLQRHPRNSMSTSTVVNGSLHHFDATRARVIAELKIDVLTATQETDNDATRKDISRSFICEPKDIQIIRIVSANFSPKRTHLQVHFDSVN